MNQIAILSGEIYRLLELLPGLDAHNYVVCESEGGQRYVCPLERWEAAGYASFRGKVSHRFITRMLDDERYSGRRTVNGEVIENDHKAIIDPDLYEKVQALRAISWKKQERRLATNKAKREAMYGKNSDSPAADDQP